MTSKSFFINSNYYARFFYEVLFFYFFTIIINNYFMGILVDCFNMNRKASQMKSHDISNICFICGGKKDLFEKHNIRFEDHISITHNLIDYISYLIYIRNMDYQDLNYNNSYVKKMVDEGKIGFFPQYEEAVHEEKIEYEEEIKQLSSQIKGKEDKRKTTTQLYKVKEQID